MKQCILLLLACAVLSCKQDNKLAVTNLENPTYDIYLGTAQRPTYEAALAEKAFWSNKMQADSSSVGVLAPLAGVYSTLFDQTGDAAYLVSAEQLLKKGREVSANQKDSYGHGLAKNYISQHRFKEAREMLETIYSEPNNKRNTELMLFDVYMELGDYEKADTMLGNVKNNSDYNYLIRLAKWSDYRGDLDAAIKYLEQAKGIAKASGKKALMVWTYSNIADYYGHAGRIEDSYNHFMQTLAIEPDNAYAKKGIAWIKYSKEHNTKEATRILDSIMVHHKVPDYHLLKAEMASFDGDEDEVQIQEQLFLQAVEHGNYGAMYNTYLIELLVNSDPKRALVLATEEIGNRATPETYHLLAYAQLKNNDPKAALATIEEFVEGKTFEPMAQYHSALVYKANGLVDKVTPIKEELMEATFELGPVLAQEVKRL